MCTTAGTTQAVPVVASAEETGPLLTIPLEPVSAVSVMTLVGTRSNCRPGDVGCGSGITLLTLAEAFHRSRFDGYDPSRYAIGGAHANLASRRLANVTVTRRTARTCRTSLPSTWCSPSTACTTCPTQTTR